MADTDRPSKSKMGADPSHADPSHARRTRVRSRKHSRSCLYEDARGRPEFVSLDGSYIFAPTSKG